MRNKVPILFLVFNRPSTTLKVFDNIKRLKPEKLFIVANGPREDKVNEKEKCEEVRKITEKIILKKVYSDTLPGEILKRKKQGFGVGSAINNWMGNKLVKDMVFDIMNNNNSRVYNLIPKDRVAYFMKKKDYKSWILLNLALWFEKHEFAK